MKTKLLITGLLVAGMAINADAQVQANKQLQMTGSNDNDRRITGVGSAIDSADAVNAATLLNSRLTFAHSTVSGNNYAVQLRVAPESYAAGMILSFKAAGANTGAITLNVNSLGAKPVFKNVSEALEAGDIVPNQVVSVIYDGTAFQIISQLKTAAGFKGNLSGDVVGTQDNTLIRNDAVTTGKIADGAVTNDKVAPGISYSKLVDVPTALPPTGAASGDLAGSYPAPQIKDAAVSNAKLANGAVTSLKIQDGAIISLKLADGSVLTAKVADAAITTTKLGDGAVTGAKIADGAVTNEKIASVAYTKITGAPTSMQPSGTASGDLTGSYPAPQIKDAAVTNAKIAAGAVTTDKINTTGAVSGQVLTYNGTGAVWTVPNTHPTGAAGGDLAGSYPNPAIGTGAVTTNKIADGAVTNDKVGYGISYNKLVDVPTTLPPSGAAGGDLENSYPNPLVKPGAITNGKLADGAVSTGKLVDGAVTNDKIATVDYSKITNAPASLPPSGTAGGDLENTYPNPAVRTGAITSSKIADGAVSGSKLATGAVGTAAVADGAITNDKIATVDYAKITNAPAGLPPTGDAYGDLEGSTYPAPVVKGGAITNAKIADGAVTASKLATGAVTTAAVANGAITNEKIATVDYSKITGAPTSMQPAGDALGDLEGQYPAPNIKTGAVTNTKLASGAVTADKINGAGAANGQVLTYNGTNVVWTTPATVLTGAASGDLTGMYPNPQIAGEAVTTGKIAAGAVTNDKVAYGISYNKLVDVPTALPPSGAAGGDLAGSYPAPVIASGAVTNGKIADGAVNSTKVAGGAISNSHVAAGAAIDYSKLNLSNSVTGTDLIDGSVSANKIVNGAVTNEKITSVDYSKITNAPAGLPPTGVAGGDLDGTYPAPVVRTGAINNDKIADGAVTGSKIAAGAVGTTAVLDGAITNEKIVTVDYAKITSAPGSLPPSGDASGDLDGVYPAPIIRAGAVTSTKIAAGAVTPDKINTTGAVSGHVLTYDGTGAVWTVANTHPTGAAGGDLTGTYPNPSIRDAAVTGTKLAAGAVTNSHISNTASIAYSKLNLANSIVSTDLANNSVTTFKIANGAVTTSKINTAGASTGQVLTYNGSTVTWGTVSSVPGGAAGGDLTGTYPNPVIADEIITSNKIADGAITNADVSATAGITYSKLDLANSITGSDIVNSAISGEKIADGAVTTAKVADGAITDAKLASGISYSKLIGVPTYMKPLDAAGGDLTGTYPNPTIGTGKVTDVKIADGAVVANKIATGAVQTGKLADGAVTPAKISTAGASSGQVLSFNGTQVVWASPSGSGATALQFHGAISSAVAYSTGNTVTFPDALTNVGSQMNTATGVFTAAAAGLYQINASLPSEADGARFLALRVNGVDVFTGSAASAFYAGSPYNATVSALSLGVAYPLAAADQVEIIVYTNSGTATPLTNGSARLLITRLN